MEGDDIPELRKEAARRETEERLKSAKSFWRSESLYVSSSLPDPLTVADAAAGMTGRRSKLIMRNYKNRFEGKPGNDIEKRQNESARVRSEVQQSKKQNDPSFGFLPRKTL